MCMTLTTCKKISHLFLDVNSVRELCDASERFFLSKEDIFSYFTRLQENVSQVEKLEHVTEESGQELKIPQFMITLKMLQAVASKPKFAHYTQEVMRKSQSEFLKITPDEILKNVYRIHVAGNQLD